jgi:hypothetical protein
MIMDKKIRSDFGKKKRVKGAKKSDEQFGQIRETNVSGGP